ncbi:MAG: HU family DNA-binding protein [Planctomycetota bacterium]
MSAPVVKRRAVFPRGFSGASKAGAILTCPRLTAPRSALKSWPVLWLAKQTAGKFVLSINVHVAGDRLMNKGQLIDAVASELGGSKASAGRAVEAVIRSIRRGLKKDQAVTIIGFGTFLKKNRPARTGRNPVTGEPMRIKASNTVNFKASQSLKISV